MQSRIKSITLIGARQVYDITVADDHSFIANDFVVHNCKLPNLTQIPAAKDQYGIKKCFTAGKGQSLICLDFAQLELRIGTMYHQDPVMMKVLRDPKGDLHQVTADQFNVPRDPLSKNINFLFQFGGNAYALAELMCAAGIPTTPEAAEPLRKRYDEVYAGVSPWRKSLLREHSHNGFVRLLTGRKRHLLRGINWEDKWALHKAETTLSNNVVQGAGQDFLKATIIRADYNCINVDRCVAETLPDTRHRHLLKDYARLIERKRKELKLAKVHWLLQVHDEALWVCDESAEEEVLYILAQIMVLRHFFPMIKPFCVPLVTEGGVAKNWKDAKSKECKLRIKYGFDEPIEDV
jgi:DNA polymerase I-like protein with 3'-5' exonuclease and polymerase domains